MTPALGSITDETIAMTRQIALQNLKNGTPMVKDVKGITVSGDVLYGYPLEAPSKKLYFIEDAMRRRIPRFVNQTGGTIAHWKQITAINASKIKASVAEGAINSDITYSDKEMTATYKSLSMTGKYSDESRVMGRKFEDVPAYTMLSTLQSLMIQEDRYDIGGNITALGPPSALTVTDSATAGSLTASTGDYDYAVSALTIHGWLNGAKGRINSVNSDDETTPVAVTNHGALGGAVTSVDLAWTDVPGAFAYNVYITLHSGTYKWQKTVFQNGCNLGTITASTSSCNTADTTADAYGYDGILAQLMLAGSGAYYKSMANAVLTADGAGGIVQIEDALASIWNNYRIGPTMGLINAQQARDMKKLMIGSSSTNAVRLMIDSKDARAFDGGSAVGTYWSPYMQQEIPLITSVHCPKGKIFLLGERVPYPNSEVPQNFEKELQLEYYGQEFAKTDRTQKLATTFIGVMKVYLPGACGVIANIKDS